MTFLEQIRRHAVALISLAVAVTSLGYNTWRNERTEFNRNVRQASFEVLKSLGELQIIADHAHYERDFERGNPITGWGRVALVRDLASLVSPKAGQAAGALYTAWQGNWESLGGEESGIESITAAIATTRDEVLQSLAALD